MTKQIPLTRGYVALVDDEDYDQLSQRKWHYYPCNGRDYAARRVDRRIVIMHRFIVQAQPGQLVDHRNGDGLDNQRSNLRIATTAQNAANQRKPQRSKPSTSQFKGVYWSKHAQKWAAQLRVEGEKKHLGLFADEAAAARAYDAAARLYFGDFARPNFAE